MLLPWFVLILEGLIVKLLYLNENTYNPAICVIVITINVISSLIAIVLQRKEKYITAFMCGGLVFRLFLLIWDLQFRNIYVLPNSGLDTESFAFWALNGFWTGDYMRGGVYARFIAFWYKFFGIQRPIAQYVNVLLAVSIMFLVVKIMDYLDINNDTQRHIIFLICFLPNFSITNSILLRETLIVFLISAGLYLFLKFICENRFRFLVANILLVCVAAAIHSGAIAVLLGEAMTIVLYDRRSGKLRIHAKSIITLFAVMAIFIVLYSQFGELLFGKFQGVDSASDVINTANRYNSGSSSYDAGFSINNSIISLIVNTPIRMFYFVASPLPWNWRGITDIIAFSFSSVLFIYAYIRAATEIMHPQKTDRKSMIIIFTILALSGALVFAWGVSNAGTAVRHREKFIIIYLMLIALCNDTRKRKFANET